jgi:hypothetical protein
LSLYFAQRKNKIPFREVIEQKTILLVKLSKDMVSVFKNQVASLYFDACDEYFSKFLS